MNRFAFVFVAILLLLGISPTFVKAQSEKTISPQRLEQLLRDLEAIEQQQQQLLAEQEAILSEAKGLKILARKQ